MVLNEAQDLTLVDRISAQVESDTLRVILLQPIIEFLVVAKVKSMLLQFPLQSMLQQ